MRETVLGPWSILCGVAAAGGVIAAEMLAEQIDRMQQHTGEKAYPGFAGFDFDDVLYLFAPLIWLGWQMPLVAGATVGAPAFALLTWVKLRRARGARRASVSPSGR